MYGEPSYKPDEHTEKRFREVQASTYRRMMKAREIGNNPLAQALELARCIQDPLYWMDNWVTTYDPRSAAEAHIPSLVPFDLFPRQRELIKFVDERLRNREDGLVEKSRGMGFTWVVGCYAWHKWRWQPGFKTTFGSRKVEYVDRIGDPDSIFEKIRMMMKLLPNWMLPDGFNWREHSNHLLLLNPENGNTIRGEGGEEMGRGGRSTLYVLDEAAFYKQAERVDAATSSNTDVRIWGSTVNGMDNAFARKRFGQYRPEQIFRLHYSDNPLYSEDWLRKKKGSMESHLWASEFEIDYSASVEGVVIPGAWVEAAKRIYQYVDILPATEGVAGGDIGGGRNKSVHIARFGPLVMTPVAWGDPDTTDTAIRLLDESMKIGFTRYDKAECRVVYLRYDSVGIGAGITSAMRRNRRPGLTVSGVNTGAPPSDTRWSDGMTSKEKFVNLKAEIWWTMRDRFLATYETVMHYENDPHGRLHPIEELISLPPDNSGPDALALAAQLSVVRAFKNERGKIAIESKADLIKRGASSPDHADALALTFVPPGLGEQWARIGRQGKAQFQGIGPPPTSVFPPMRIV